MRNPEILVMTVNRVFIFSRDSSGEKNLKLKITISSKEDRNIVVLKFSINFFVILSSFIFLNHIKKEVPKIIKPLYRKKDLSNELVNLKMYKKIEIKDVDKQKGIKKCFLIMVYRFTNLFLSDMNSQIMKWGSGLRKNGYFLKCFYIVGNKKFKF